MSKASEKEQALAVATAAPLAAIIPAGITSFQQFADFGFTENASIKVGDPTNAGNIGLYAGELLGPGADIELSDDAGTMPTWLFHPLTLDENKKLAPIKKIVHNVICSSQLDAACKQAMARKQTLNCRLFLVMEYAGQGKNRKNLPLNKFNVAVLEQQ